MAFQDSIPQFHKTSSPNKEFFHASPQYQKPPAPLTPPTTPPPLPRRPVLHQKSSSRSSQSSPVIASSLESMQESANSPPLLLPERSKVAGAHVVLYVFRVPGSHDLCLSLAKPLRKIITEVDIQLALYYVKVGFNDSILIRDSQITTKLHNDVIEMLGKGYHKFGNV